MKISTLAFKLRTGEYWFQFHIKQRTTSSVFVMFKSDQGYKTFELLSIKARDGLRHCGWTPWKRNALQAKNPDYKPKYLQL